MKSSSILKYLFKEYKVFAIVSIFLFSFNAFADNFEKGLKAYNQGEYSKAADYWLKASSISGDTSVAQFNLGALYESGVGVKKDLGVAAYWFRLSSEQGYSPAKFRLGQLYLYDEPQFPKNINGVLYWWEAAAQEGNTDAQIGIAKLLIQGIEIEKDLLTAQYWLDLAAQTHHPDAIALLQQLENELRRLRVQDGAWILSQNSNLYTIELYASSDKEDARNFAYRSGLELSAIYQSLYGDHIVIVGLFDSLGQAYQQIDNLPEKIKQYKPRPRILEIVKTEIVDKTNAGQRQEEGENDTAQEFLAKNKPVISNVEWIKAQDSSKYTIQLYTTFDKQEGELFIKQFGLENAAIYETVTRQFIVVAGLFDNAQQATQALTLLPANILQFGAKPKLIAEIQRDLLLVENNTLQTQNKTSAQALAFQLTVPELSSGYPDTNQANTDTTTSDQSKPASEQKTEPSLPTGKQQLADLEIFGEDWIKERPSDRFTVRLLKTRDHEEARSFILQYGLENSAIYSARGGGYAVVTTEFFTLEEALGAVSLLPELFKTLDIVIRPFSQIQADIQPDGDSQREQGIDKADPNKTTEGLNWQWILKQPPKHYTLKIFAADTLEKVRNFIRSHEIADAVIYRSRRGRKPYKAIQGNYESKGAAKKAIAQIGKEQKQKFKPARVTFSSIIKKLADHADQPQEKPERLKTGA